MKQDVLLYSGGMDSAIGRLYLNDRYYNKSKERELLSLYINYKGSACEKEKKIVKNLDPAVKIIDNVLNLSGKEGGAHNLLFGRNLYFCILAAELTDKYIYLLGLKNSVMPDNTPYFFKKASAVLSEIKGKEIVVCSPFVDKPVDSLFYFYGRTKEEVVDWYIQQNYSLLKLLEGTSSCFYDEHMFCGQCLSCFYFYCAVYKYIKKQFNPIFDKWKNRFINKELVKQELKKARAGIYFSSRAEAIEMIAKDMDIK